MASQYVPSVLGQARQATGLATTFNSTANITASDYTITLPGEQTLLSCNNSEQGAKKPLAKKQNTVIPHKAHAIPQSQLSAHNGEQSAHGEEQLQYSEDEDYDPEYDTTDMPLPPPTAAQLKSMKRRRRREESCKRNERKRKIQKMIEQKFPDTHEWAKYLIEHNVPSRSLAAMEASKANVENLFALTEHTLWEKIDWSQTRGVASFEREMSPGGTTY
ncbi:hypothetical protein ACHAQH_001122 [Verticillium albo-atrum]